MEKKILNIVLSPIIYRNKILLLQRKKPPFKDLWGMPGGKLDFGENLEEAIAREIREETDLPVKFVAIRGLVNEIFHDVKAKEKVAQSMIFVCEVAPKHTRHTGSEEGDLKWFKLGQLGKHKKEIIPSDYLMIRRFILKENKKIKLHKVKMMQSGNIYKIGKTDL
jgi:8-oxo-dGTP diphosphatase